YDLLKLDRRGPYMLEVQQYHRAMASENLQVREQGDLRYFQAVAQVFAGMQYETLLDFSRDVWNQGILGLYEGEPLKYWIDPTLAYLIAMGQEGALRSRDREQLGVAFISAAPSWAARPLL